MRQTGRIVVVVVRVDWGVCLLIVRRHRERCLVRVNVLILPHQLIIARQPVVPLPVFDSVDADERGYAKENTAYLLASVICTQLVPETYVTKTPSATIALLMPHAVPHNPAELYAACVAKADNQMMVKRPSTVAIARGSASFRVRGNRGAIHRYTHAGNERKHCAKTNVCQPAALVWSHGK